MKKNLFVYYAGEHEYDPNNAYGHFMLNKKFLGKYAFAFCQLPENNYDKIEMDEKAGGRVYFNGKPVPYELEKSDMDWNGYWILTVNMRDKNLKPGETYTIRVEGFRTADGVEMDPAEAILHCTAPANDAYDPKYEKHDSAALDVAREGIVLLKNDGGVLPLKNRKINVFGSIYSVFYNQSGGAGSIFPRFSYDFVEGLCKFGGFEFNPEVEKLYRENPDAVPTEELLQRAETFSDTAIVTISRGTSENIDNESVPGEYYLKECEKEMLFAVCAKFRKTIVILNTGYQVDVRDIIGSGACGVIWLGLGGMYAGRAISEVLTGEVNPSGRLPDTWGLDYGDFPSSKNFIETRELVSKGNIHRTCVTNVYEEGIYIGYRYFDTFGVPVAYPFGYGLSYTAFSARLVNADYNGEKLTLSAEVENIGGVSGKNVVQVYISEPDGKLEKCAHRLVDFGKTRELMPGEKQTLEFSVDNNFMSSYDAGTSSYILESGEYSVYLGENINSLEKVYAFTVENTVTVKKCHHYCLPKEKFTTLSKYDPEGTYPTGKLSHYETDKDSFDFAKNSRDTHFEDREIPQYNGDTIFYTDLEKNPSLIDKFIGQMSVPELARLNVCAQAWSMETNGVAGAVYRLDKYKMKSFLTADGNSGLRLSKRTVGFPSSNMVCASFNRETAYTVGRVIAEESVEEKVHFSLAPGMNLHRNPLCGRNAEYFSEDPLLSGIMAGYHAKGLQDNGVGAVIKHVIGNNAELCRFRSNSIIDERTMRELYVKNFEIAMSVVMPDGIMTAYNATNDCYTGMDEELIMGIFRNELGFDGYVMTDWTSYNTCDPVEAVRAGNCWLTPGSEDNTYTKPIEDAVADGRIPLARLQNNVKHIVKVMLKYTKKFEN